MLHPKRLTYSRDATLILLMIGGLVTALFVSGIFAIEAISVLRCSARYIAT